MADIFRMRRDPLQGYEKETLVRIIENGGSSQLSENPNHVRFSLLNLRRKRYLREDNGTYRLSPYGARIVSFLGVGIEAQFLYKTEVSLEPVRALNAYWSMHETFSRFNLVKTEGKTKYLAAMDDGIMMLAKGNRDGTEMYTAEEFGTNTGIGLWSDPCLEILRTIFQKDGKPDMHKIMRLRVV